LVIFVGFKECFAKNKFIIRNFYYITGNTPIPIPKGTLLFFNKSSILNDNKYWENPGIFNPNRFLDTDHHFVGRKSKEFLPFGIGKRVCIGNKIALDLLFLTLTQFLQSTHGYHIQLSNYNVLNFESKIISANSEPKTYKIFFAAD
jgi:cytochrome P450